MAAGAIARCLKHYGEATLIMALQCVTQTSNNKTGALSARMIKALCAVLRGNPGWLDQGTALLDVFDSIDLMAIQKASAVDGAAKKIGRIQAMSDRIHVELNGAGSSSGVALPRADRYAASRAGRRRLHHVLHRSVATATGRSQEPRDYPTLAMTT
jgi:hypothetical protein